MLEMEFGVTIHIIHISGKRMIAQGTNGCSRGSLLEGVMAGKDMLTFVDLALPATERHPPLLDWVRLWTNCRRVMGSLVVSQTRTTSGSPRMKPLGKSTYGLRRLQWRMRHSKNY